MLEATCLANLHKQFSDNSILSLSFVTGEMEGWGERFITDLFMTAWHFYFILFFFFIF